LIAHRFVTFCHHACHHLSTFPSPVVTLKTWFLLWGHSNLVVDENFSYGHA
jgi:hypothetical protein